MNSPRGVRLKAWVTLTAVAVAGFGLGMVVDRWRAQRQAPPAMTWVQSRGSAEGDIQSLPGPLLFEELELTPTQQASVDSILDHAQARLDSSMVPLLGQIKVTVADAHTAVRALLTEEQLARFDSVLATLPILQLRSEGP